MALWTCLACGTRFAVGLPACPHCLSTDYTEADVPDGYQPQAPAPEPPAAALSGSADYPDAPVVPEPAPPATLA